MKKFVYKIVDRDAWEQATRAGAFAGSHDDLRDGFIHLSDADQLASTLEKHFSGQQNLIVVQFETDALAPDLKWEVSRVGALFPHLYAPLPTRLARGVAALDVDDNGMHRLPDMAGL